MCTKIPLDVELLRLGLKYAQLRSKAADFRVLCKSGLTLSTEKVPSSVYNNLRLVHAKVHDADPSVLMIFGPDYEETLIYDPNDRKIAQISAKNEYVADVRTQSGLTSLDLLSTVIPYTIADAICDLDFHRAHMDENMEAFGQKGADNVEAFKNKWLEEYNQLKLPAYKLEDPFVADLDELRVTLGFECIMKGKEGKGTDFVTINSDKLLTKIVVKREIPLGIY